VEQATSRDGQRCNTRLVQESPTLSCRAHQSIGVISQWEFAEPEHLVFTDRTPFLSPNQQRQSTEGKSKEKKHQKRKNNMKKYKKNIKRIKHAGNTTIHHPAVNECSLFTATPTFNKCISYMTTGFGTSQQPGPLTDRHRDCS